MDQVHNTPMVSVVMITYGHEAFIRQAVEGVLMQECNFPVELIVADDCSPDNTPAVMQEIMENHPRASWIRYTRHPKNKGMMPNFIWALRQAKGKYIALCEGDDYWTDSYKLQKQVGFLEEKERFVACFHLAENDVRRPQNNRLTVLDILKQHNIPTCTLVFRNILNSELFSLLNDIKILSGDIYLELHLALRGDFLFLNETMAFYRIHENSISCSKNNIQNGLSRYLYLLNKFDKDTKGIYTNNIKEKGLQLLRVEFNKSRINKEQSFITRIKLFLLHYKMIGFRDFKEFRDWFYIYRKY